MPAIAGIIDRINIVSPRRRRRTKLVKILIFVLKMKLLIELENK